MVKYIFFLKAPFKAYDVDGSTLDPVTEIRSWVVNKCLGETPLHRAARLGYLVRDNDFVEMDNGQSISGQMKLI